MCHSHLLSRQSDRGEFDQSTATFARKAELIGFGCLYQTVLLQILCDIHCQPPTGFGNHSCYGIEVLRLFSTQNTQDIVGLIGQPSPGKLLTRIEEQPVISAAHQLHEFANLTCVVGAARRCDIDRTVPTAMENERRMIGVIELDDFSNQYLVIAAVISEREATLEACGTVVNEWRVAITTPDCQSFEPISRTTCKSIRQVLLVCGQNMDSEGARFREGC